MIWHCCYCTTGFNARSDAEIRCDDRWKVAIDIGKPSERSISGQDRAQVAGKVVDNLEVELSIIQSKRSWYIFPNLNEEKLMLRNRSYTATGPTTLHNAL